MSDLPPKGIVPPQRRRAWLNAARNAKMARSPHAYVRGNTRRFYEWLGEDGGDRCVGPSLWICGDCHVGNLGPVAGPDGEVSIEIRDLDQTVIGDPSLDLIRLGVSLATIARGSSLPGIMTTQMLEALLKGYLQGLLEATPVDTRIAPSIHIVFRQSLRRRWRDLAAERIEGRRQRIPLGSRFWPISDVQRSELERLTNEAGVQALAGALRHRDEDESIALRDAAYWVKGCSSLGLLRYALLVDVGSKAPCLLDVKAAVASVAPTTAAGAMPDAHGERVVAGARALAPALGSRMAATTVARQSVFVRELLPQDLKIDIELLTEKDAAAVAFLLASVVGRAHGRQLRRDDARAWARVLRRSHTKSLAAPSWLWTTIVQSIARHETEYLAHCRRFAASAARSPRK